MLLLILLPLTAAATCYKSCCCYCCCTLLLLPVLSLHALAVALPERTTVALPLVLLLARAASTFDPCWTAPVPWAALAHAPVDVVSKVARGLISDQQLALLGSIELCQHADCLPRRLAAREVKGENFSLRICVPRALLPLPVVLRVLLSLFQRICAVWCISSSSSSNNNSNCS
jgi:hypothetical protein